MGADDDAHYPVPGKVGKGLWVSRGNTNTERLCCCPKNLSALQPAFTVAGLLCGIFSECGHVENDSVPAFFQNLGDSCGFESWECMVAAARVFSERTLADASLPLYAHRRRGPQIPDVEGIDAKGIDAKHLSSADVEGPRSSDHFPARMFFKISLN